MPLSTVTTVGFTPGVATSTNSRTFEEGDETQPSTTSFTHAPLTQRPRVASQRTPQPPQLAASSVVEASHPLANSVEGATGSLVTCVRSQSAHPMLHVTMRHRPISHAELATFTRPQPWLHAPQ